MTSLEGSGFAGGEPRSPVAQVLQTLRKGVTDDDQVRGLVEGASLPMVILDAQGALVVANSRAEAFFARERQALVGAPFVAVISPSERARVSERLEASLRAGEGPGDLDTFIEDPVTGAIPAALTFLPFNTRSSRRLALIIRDTAREGALRGHVRDLEHQLAESAEALAQSQGEAVANKKLTDLGRLTSGIAHELKTPISYIENQAVLQDRQLARLVALHPELAEPITRLRTGTATIIEGANRVKNLLAQLQPLARNRPARRVPVDLRDLVMDAVRTFHGSTTSECVVTLDLQTTHAVSMDIEEMSRVLVNLLNNASEAMGGKGRIVVSTRNRECPPQLRVQDEGPGLTPEVEARLFEPFLTTKERGTGLGLAISRRIVEAHGGTLTHERPASGGAAFIVRFPMHDT